MTYQQTLDYLFSQLLMFQRVGAAAYKNDLNNTIALMKHLGNPENKFKSIHIAGTNGKGSTSHLLASIFQSAGYKTGLFTSPHLKDFRERIRINGQMISESRVVEFVETNLNFLNELKPSFFEMSAGMAFDFFAKEKVDIAVVEVGIGGRLDSTNVVTPEMSIITNIGYDHTQFLGDTLAKIAVEKAGIIKPNIPVIIGEFNAETVDVFNNFAKKNNAEIHFADLECNLTNIKRNNDNLQFTIYNLQFTTPLTGIYQEKNILTIFAAVNVLKNKFHLSDEAIKKGFVTVIDNTELAGRWQILREKPLTVADVGHNVDGIRQVLEHLKLLKYSKLHFVFGMVSDKDIRHVLELLPKDAQYYFCNADLPRALNSDVLQQQALLYGLLGRSYGSVANAFKNAQMQAHDDDMILIGGSNFVVAEVI
ncbi:MAG: bifunctional folylpolyglutamate synthase/dihydrofolate synthase [Bacteroidales bacterium]|jgi:dihydrofolate synthase/folylpolyglutamate synthase|nr:bifunctional folylpolyglutamate synthase/dihydrofolate synthase [Bacteroidales bacterium]